MKSSVTFEIEGLNQLKLINTLKNEGIALNVNRQNQKLMIVTVDRKSKAKTIELVDKLGFSYSVTSEKSAVTSLKSALPRLGLVVGLIVMIALSVYATSFLWKIEISGNDRIDELTIIRILKDKGISIGAKKNFTAVEVEDALLKLDDISAVSAEIKGTTLKIDIIESTVISPVKQEGEIVSLYDAEITRIIVNSGSAKVKIGDRIPIGAVLIESAEYDTAGNKIKDVEAQGTVYGKVNFSHSEIVSLSGGYRRTGKFTENTVIVFFGHRIGKDVPREGCETEKTIARIGSFFPIYAETTKYYEVEKTADLKLEDVKRSVIDKSVNDLIIRAGGSAITTTATTAEIAEKVYKITVHIEAEVSVGGKRI